MNHVVLPQADVERYEAIEAAAKELVEYLEVNGRGSFWVPYKELARILAEKEEEK